MERKPSLDKKSQKRIDSYAEAIKNFGVKKLLNKLIETKILGPEYSYNTFKTYFRRLKANKTGPFLTPHFLIPILRHLDDFTYKDLFEDDETGKYKQENMEKNRDLFKSISELKMELKKDISVIKEKVINPTHKNYIYSKDIYNSARIIFNIINIELHNGILWRLALYTLFVCTTYQNKKIWNHGHSEHLSRVDNIFNHITTKGLSKIYTLAVSKGYEYPSFLFISDSEAKVLALGNFYLVIAYQMYLIEKMYKLLMKKNINEIIIKKKDKLVNSSFEDTRTEILTREIIMKKLYEDKPRHDVFLDKINNFYTTFDSKLEKYLENEFLHFSIQPEEQIPSDEYLQGLLKIIVILNEILSRFVFPKQAGESGTNNGYKLETTLELLKNETTIEENSVINLTENDLVAFEECIGIFKSLEYKKKGMEELFTAMSEKMKIPQMKNQKMKENTVNKEKRHILVDVYDIDRFFSIS